MVTREQDSLDQRWQAFQNLEQIRNHWYWRPGWRVGRSFYTWHLTFGGAEDLHRLVDTLQDQILAPSVDLVPHEGLHLTMQGVGFADEVTPADLDAIIAAAHNRCRNLSPFNLTLGPVDPDAEGIGLLVSPWQPVAELRSQLRQAIGTVWPQVPESEDGFRPHVTIAYTNADAPAAPVRDQLAPLRDVPPVLARVEAVQLIQLHRDRKIYEWDVRAGIPLGSSSRN
jgi:2'-5' RNA ligase